MVKKDFLLIGTEIPQIMFLTYSSFKNLIYMPKIFSLLPQKCELHKSQVRLANQKYSYAAVVKDNTLWLASLQLSLNSLKKFVPNLFSDS
jgi:hypothetical protein